MKKTTAPHVFTREFDGELVILDLDAGDYFGLDRVGKALWEGLVAGTSMHAIVSELAARYEVEPGRLEQDLTTLRDELVAKGFLVDAG